MVETSPTISAQEPEPSHGLTTEKTDIVNQMFIGAVKDDWMLFSDRASDYRIGEPIGYGASSIVYAATFRPPAEGSSKPPPPTPCALKVLDLDSLPRRSLQLLQRETTLMSLSKHPNVLRVRGSWIDGSKLFIALRLMNKGSAADVMRYGWPGGMEEDVIRCILRQALQGLNYLHINGFIHRDVKAANLLINDDGTVLLGDLGVAADLTEDTSQHMHSNSGKSPATPTQTKRSVAFDDRPAKRIGKRKSFVGTPCWMAPELVEGRQYDSAADIWSFGITALELSQGRPPGSRRPPKEVLLRIIRDESPTLDREGGTFKYSRTFKEMIDSCLVKDPAERPTAEQLLQTPFFKGSKKPTYLINTILNGLPPLTQRQERRSARHLTLASTVDSWDFAMTAQSPMSTIPHRRPLTEDALSPTPECQEKFDFDDDNEASPNNATGLIPTAVSLPEDDKLVNRVDLTPPDDSPSPTSSTPKLTGQVALTPHGEEHVKKSFWSRITPRLRKISSLRGRNSFIVHADDGLEKISPSSVSESRTVLSSSGKAVDVPVRPTVSSGNTHATVGSSTKKRRMLGGMFGEARGIA
ncbi:hypothetical protein AGABI1DRAFT_110126 [Agaricus bisporus var. burnettii JB137-S8]|uniref:Protein kinase domain-containing protein n=1 Tax=Agaricus bisporus var. burnettii (strain JB137-S8 / ATCC MYA-4627 / FGSC 10392) TaxID=597362 RepID=K5W9C4_AGABU|nr:uncharacterized protein AGABI1DRAFT_110126 [Agaricus bisporus var. burnettii JB137-S8]EKM83474.1 hypothetical protein AGABI1DRAFT_110126 [Agaricus bisporus var. burnettii JB137-S8]